MKKRLNFVSVFLLMITCVSAFVFSVSGGMKVAAADSPRTEDAMVIGSASDKNYVKLTKEGAITIQYEYGYSELLIVLDSTAMVWAGRRGRRPLPIVNRDGITTDKRSICADV